MEPAGVSPLTVLRSGRGERHTPPALEPRGHRRHSAQQASPWHSLGHFHHLEKQEVGLHLWVCLTLRLRWTQDGGSMGSRLSSREPCSADSSGGFPASSLTHSAYRVDRPGVITSASPASLCASWRAVTHRNT